MSKLNRDGVGRSLERILEKQPTEVQTVAAANTAEGNEMTQVALDRNDKERTEIIHRVADINFVVATIIASAAFSAAHPGSWWIRRQGFGNFKGKNNFFTFLGATVRLLFFQSSQCLSTSGLRLLGKVLKLPSLVLLPYSCVFCL
jgi:hypothetical protein